MLQARESKLLKRARMVSDLRHEKRVRRAQRAPAASDTCKAEKLEKAAWHE